MSAKRFARHQRSAILTGILVVVLLIVVCQLWLFTVTMEAWLGGDASVIVPAALASFAGLALNLGLVRYLRALDR